MPRGIRTLIVLVVALAAAGVASFMVYRAMPRTAPQPAGPPMQSVVVAAKALPVGTLISAADVKLIQWPAQNPIPGSLPTIESAVGRGVLSGVAEDEPITEGKLAARGAGAGLPPSIPEGMRAISVKVDDVIAVAGFTVPGTHVDVLATVTEGQEARTRTVVSNLTVLTAGTRYDQAASKDGKPIPSTVVTLLATPADAEKIALAATAGKIILALRNPMDTAPTETQGIRLAALLGPAAPPPTMVPTRHGVSRALAAPPPPPPPAPYRVEKISGAKRTEEVVK